ncbi:MAG: hypothetical protein NTU59_02225, partial [Coprothermobacterota bacterium]|nr:hypothetical protein [Coprothermobacterota bacterium]
MLPTGAVRFFVPLLVLTLLLTLFGFPLAIAQDGLASDPNTSIPPPEPALFQFHLAAGWNLIS